MVRREAFSAAPEVKQGRVSVLRGSDDAIGDRHDCQTVSSAGSATGTARTNRSVCRSSRRSRRGVANDARGNVDGGRRGDVSRYLVPEPLV